MHASPRDSLNASLRSRACQVAGIALTLALVAALHRHGDGLWFQGDAPRHAANGLFWWDLLNTLPRDPVAFALSYYARYPVIQPAAYPPLFYLLEGTVFAVVGPSPYAAKFIVLLFAGVAGLYTMAWTRRWIGPLAGWAGAFLAFTPAMVVWSNTVMLNVPATALGMATLYHCRRWLETSEAAQFVLAASFLTAVLLTYYTGISVLFICAAWVTFRWQNLRFGRHVRWITVGALAAFVPLALALVLAPVHTTRQLPTLALLTRSRTWTFYWMTIPQIVGGPMLVLALAGGAAGFLTARWRAEAAYIAIWIAVLILGLSFLPAKDPRYILLIVPAFAIAAVMGFAAAAQYLRRLPPEGRAALLAAGLAIGFWSASRIHVPQVSGFRELAMYLRDQAPTGAVLYDGNYDGLFGFYVRALDPGFDRRLVLGSKVLYQYGPAATFKPIEKSYVASADDVVQRLRTEAGCTWIAIEVGRSSLRSGQRLLREAVARGNFEFVRSFPITGAQAYRVDLYRLVDSIAPVVSVDLEFPSYTDRTFHDIVPIARRE